jgi:NH3-dependent NAD+ synthetase
VVQAELRPVVRAAGEAEGEGAEHSQLDEDEMGMSYDELGVFG